MYSREILALDSSRTKGQMYFILMDKKGLSFMIRFMNKLVWIIPAMIMNVDPPCCTCLETKFDPDTRLKFFRSSPLGQHFKSAKIIWVNRFCNGINTKWKDLSGHLMLISIELQ